jgi:acetyl-CoA acetyltransferase family protein
MEEIYIAGGARTALGNFGGSLKDRPMTDLAAEITQAAIARVGAEPKDFDHMVFTTTCPTDRDSLFSARVVGMKSDLPAEAGALDVSRACASGLQAILAAGQQIATGHSQLAIAAGAEMFSRAPFAVTTSRWGQSRGHQQLEDMLEWCYRCPFSLEYMGDTAENLAAKYGYQRDAMDEYALRSQELALKAIASGFFAKQIHPVTIPEGKGSATFAVDESPRAGLTASKLASLRPAFQENGCVTAGNASGVTDGAAAIIVGNRAAMASKNIQPIAKLIDWTVVGVEPSLMGHGPVPAIQQLLERVGLSIGDIDYFEVNEAFAVVNLHVEAELGVSRERHNCYGGGISVGHPPGVTGLRMMLNATQHLNETKSRYAILSMCMGAGQGMAMLIENPSA